MTNAASDKASHPVAAAADLRIGAGRAFGAGLSAHTVR